MAKEIENKYLAVVEHIPKGLRYVRLLQGYIHIDKQKQVRVRINLTDQEAYICVKYNGLVERQEFETLMDIDEATQLYNLCDYKVEKLRAKMKYPGGLIFDFDKYDDGLTVIEIERPFAKYEVDTKIYPFIGNNIDGIYKYTNFHLAGFSEEQYENSMK